jgi:hypothetical protein
MIVVIVYIVDDYCYWYCVLIDGIIDVVCDIQLMILIFDDVGDVLICGIIMMLLMCVTIDCIV